MKTIFCRPITCGGWDQPRTHYAKGLCAKCWWRQYSLARSRKKRLRREPLT